MESVIKQLKEFIIKLKDDEELAELFEISLSETDFAVDLLCKKDKDLKASLGLYGIASRFNCGESLDNVFDVVKESLIAQYNITNVDYTFEDIKGDIYPLLETEFESPSDLVKKPFTKNGEVFIYYVRDIGSSMTFIVKEQIKEWGISEDEIHELAIKNLENRIVFPKAMQSNGETKNLFIYNSKDGYDATRVLTLDIPVLKEKFKGDICVGIPNRDFLVLFDSALSGTEFIRNQIKVDYKSHTYSLYDKVLVLKDTGWEVAE